jgi:hypothetical protein
VTPNYAESSERKPANNNGFEGRLGIIFQAA